VKCRRLDNKTGRTESALQGVMRHERFLDGVQPGGADAFDRGH
jgi:hypothetical protein